MTQSKAASQSMFEVAPGHYESLVAVAGRLLIAAIFLISGVSKVAAPAMTISYVGAAGLPFPALGFALALVIEIIGSAALIVGYRARLVAAAMAIFCVATALVFHNDLSDQNQFIHFFKNIAMAGGLLQIVALGGGRFSLDARQR